MATHLYCVTGFSWPTQLVVHDEVYRKHIQTLQRKKEEGISSASSMGLFIYLFTELLTITNDQYKACLQAYLSLLGKSL